MRLAASVAALLCLTASGAACAAPAVGAPALDDGPVPQFPPQFFRHGPGAIDPDLPGLGHPSPSVHGLPGQPVTGEGRANRETPPAGADMGAEAEPAPKPPTRAEMLDRLLGRLAKASDPDEARGIAGLVERIWMRSGSDTADLLMTRAMAAMHQNRRDVAAALLDQILTLQPGWAEAWNQRATLRFLDNDDAGSMEDISHVLTLEPRHFGALSGMGFILERHGEDKAALTALRKALAIYPENQDLRKAVDKLTPAVEGQEL